MLIFNFMGKQGNWRQFLFYQKVTTVLQEENVLKLDNERGLGILKICLKSKYTLRGGSQDTLDWE